VGHASLMRPDRPLPTRLSVICRYAATRTSPRRSSRLEYPGGIAPPSFVSQSLVTHQVSGELHPDHKIVCMRRPIVNDAVVTICFEFQ